LGGRRPATSRMSGFWERIPTMLIRRPRCTRETYSTCSTYLGASNRRSLPRSSQRTCSDDRIRRAVREIGTPALSISGERILPENVLRGDADQIFSPRLLLLPSAMQDCQGEAVRFRVIRGSSCCSKGALHLGAAESRYLYLWERCHSDVESARRASLLISCCP